MTFPNSLTPGVYSSQQTADLTNYYTEHYPTGLISNRSYDRIIYNDLYKNIDLHYYSYEDGLKFYYVIKPGGDPTDILMNFNGANSTALTSTNGVDIVSFAGNLEFKKAVVQTVDMTGTISLLTNSGDFSSPSADNFKITIEPYNPTHFVVITIEQKIEKKPNGSNEIEWSTYFGGNNTMSAEAMDVDAVGNFYVTGYLNSTNFPASDGVFNTALNGDYDGYLSFFNSDYSKLWLTYFGGDNKDRPYSVAHDNLNNVTYVSGTSISAPGTFVSQGFASNQSSYADNNITKKPGFIQRFNTSGLREWATFVAGAQGFSNNWARSTVKVDNSGNLFFVGTTNLSAISGTNNLYGTYSTVPLSNGDHPICGPTVNSYQQFAVNTGTTSRDMVLMNFDQNLNLIWSTFIGGSGNFEAATDMAIDNTNNYLYIVGVTNSAAGTPCSSTGANGFPICDQNFYFQDQISGDNDGFITRFKLNGTLDYSTFFGGADRDKITGIALNAPGDFFITGSTRSSVYSSTLCSSLTGGLFPNCPNNGYSQSHSGTGENSFVAGFRSPTNLIWSTFFAEVGTISNSYTPQVDQKIAFNDDGDLLLFGRTNSSNGIPIQASTVQNDGYFFENNYAGGSETYIARFSPAKQLLWCTHYGGSWSEINGNIVPFEDRVYICGGTASSNLLPYNCPSTVMPYCQSQNGSSGSNAFIANLRYSTDVLETEEINGNSISDIEDFLLFPNPTTGEVMVKLPNFNVKNLHIEVTDQLGKTLLIKFIDGNVDNSSLSFDLSQLTSGVYHIEVKGDNFSSLKRLVKL